MLQSIGVIIASFIIYGWPSAKIADPICTYLFTVLVMMSTCPVSRDCVSILMEEQPEDVDTEEVLKEMMKVKGIHKIRDLHVWALSGGKNVLTAHVYTQRVSKARYRGVVHKVYHELERRLERFDICHMTL